LSQTTFGILSK